jgi:hypothetical protein
VLSKRKSNERLPQTFPEIDGESIKDKRNIRLQRDKNTLIFTKIFWAA